MLSTIVLDTYLAILMGKTVYSYDHRGFECRFQSARF